MPLVVVLLQFVPPHPFAEETRSTPVEIERAGTVATAVEKFVELVLRIEVVETGIVKFTRDWAKPEEVRAIPVAQNKDTYLNEQVINKWHEQENQFITNVNKGAKCKVLNFCWLLHDKQRGCKKCLKEIK